MSFENLNYFHKTSKKFFDKYIKNFQSYMQLEKFNKFRLSFLNFAKEVKFIL